MYYRYSEFIVIVLDARRCTTEFSQGSLQDVFHGFQDDDYDVVIIIIWLNGITR